MRRITSIVLIAVILALGSGALEYVHNLAHALEDAAEDRQLAAEYNLGRPTAPRHSPLDHHHDESNCPTHAQLHMAISAGDALSPLLFVGLWQQLQRECTPQLVQAACNLRFDCRGPPCRPLNENFSPE